LKYLSFLNLSNIDNINCDSGYIFQNQLGNSLIELGHEFTLVIPAKLEDSLIDFQFHHFGTNKFQVRFSFEWDKITEIINQVNPDIIISNQPELSANIKAVILSENSNAKLYTYVHYYPFSISSHGNIIFDPSLNNGVFCESIIFTFVAGLLASDKIFVHSKYGEFLLNYLFNRHNIDLNKKEIVILPPPYDIFISQGKQAENSKNILYNHRLYKQYGTDFLIDFASTINPKFDWTIIVTDLLHNRSRNRKNLDVTVDKYKTRLSTLQNVEIRTDGNNRETYRDIICNSKISLAPFRQNCTWSMSVIDCMSVGVPVVAPNFAWFSEFIPHELLFGSMDELVKLSKKLFIDKVFYKEMSYLVSDLVLSNINLDSNQSAKLLIE
jgi:glycosyltransferase involved in cell wall biosynthesis